LPLQLNQWGNVVRWEFNNPQPFLRSREFYWQEGHSAFATKKEAEKEVNDILLKVYKKTYEEILAIPCLVGYKSEKEKFAGADYSMSCEIYLPIGKAIQGCTTHYLGQNFSKAFNIKFVNNKGVADYPHQNSWGFSTRSIGITVMTHSDSKGLVLPPKVAEYQVVIVPITNPDTEKKVNAYVDDVAKALKKFRPFVDKRNKSMGFKINNAELNGYPIRLEIGGNEVDSKKVVLVRRDTLEKEDIAVKNLPETVSKKLDEMHTAMFSEAEKNLKENIVEEYNDLKKIIDFVKKGKIVKTYFDGQKETDSIIKEKTSGKTLVRPLDGKEVKGEKCPFTGNPAKYEIYIARSL